ncbi:MAG: hypothetical protein K1X66_02480 [Verrucomicrobiae bacterium]|nr:hypothetical protein [Verrucomicrobiae bacterium]
MSHRASNWILIGLSVLSLAAFFLPWVKLKQSWDPALGRLADSLQEETEAKVEWQDFVGLDEFQREALFQNGWQSISGGQIFHDLRQSSSTAPPSRYFVDQMIGKGNFPERAYFVALFAMLPALIVLLMIVFWRRPRTFVYAGVGMFCFYLLVRWKVAVTEGARFAVGMQVGAGFWLISYSILGVALLLWVRAAFPKSKF